MLNDLQAHYERAPRGGEEVDRGRRIEGRREAGQTMLAAYTMVVNQMMNLDEALNK